ncbi:MAG: proteasome assembly chaperone family protein [Candidatus Aenigmarchaeota archaeon]|nr:proteasome assembly chaperone family protein [Candidatus Aenigmarchaeota archaeon]
METFIRMLKKVKLNNPILIEGLPGIGNVGRVSAQFLIDQLKAEKFAELYSPHFYPFTIIHNNVAEVLKNEFYYWKDPKGKNDLVILIGDSQAGESGGEGHYDIVEKILDFSEELGVKMIFTLGGFGTGEIEESKDIEVLGAANDEKLISKYEKYGVDFKGSMNRIGMIVGASGLLIGLGKLRGIDGVCLMGETTGFPILTDPRSAEKLLRVLMKILDLEIDLSELDKKSKEMERFLKRMEAIQEKTLKKLISKQEKGKENLSYIG